MPELASDGQIGMLVLAMVFFAVGLGLSLARLRRRGGQGGQGLRIAAKACFWSGVTVAMGVLIWHSQQRGNWLPLKDNFDTLVWLGLLLALFVMYVQRTRPLGGLDWFLMPVVIGLLAAAAVFGRAEPRPYFPGVWEWAHLGSVFGAAVAFAVAGAAGAMYLLVHRRLRHKSLPPLPAAGGMGSLERLEKLTFNSVSLGFALLTVGLITGIVRAIDRSGGAMGSGWMYSPTVVLTLGVWGVYALVLHWPLNPSFRGRRAAILSILGFALMVGAIVAAQFLPGGIALMQRLMMIGLNHTTAPLEVRERLAVSADRQPAAIAQFLTEFPGCEAVMLSTCNRVEIYAARPPHAKLEPGQLIEFLARFHQVPSESFAAHLYHRAGRETVEHLFAVAASLDSMVLGETQILGQVRSAYDLAKSLSATGPMLNPLFQQAVAAGKQVMQQTSLAEGRLSVASVAVDYARGIFDRFTDKTVLCIGAGKMASLLLGNLAALSPGKLLICNRDPAKAETLARKFGGQAVPMDRLTDHLVAADIVASSTGSAQPILTRKLFDGLLKQRRYRPIFLLDIAMPRDVEASVGELEHVYLYNLDDLQKVVSTTHSQRRETVDAARRIVADQVEQFLRDHRSRQMGPVIDQFVRRYHGLAQEELARTLAKLPNIGPAERAHLEELTRRIVNKLLHDPIQALREADSGAAHAPASQYLHAMRKLFQLQSEDDPTDEQL